MKLKTDKQIVDEYRKHKPEHVLNFRRMLSILRIVKSGKPKDSDDIGKLLVEAYGFENDFDELWRDLFALEELKLIKINADTECWQPCPETDFWPFGF